jgi:hypothetical protein
VAKSRYEPVPAGKQRKSLEHGNSIPAGPCRKAQEVGRNLPENFWPEYCFHIPTISGFFLPESSTWEFTF